MTKIKMKKEINVGKISKTDDTKKKQTKIILRRQSQK